MPTGAPHSAPEKHAGTVNGPLLVAESSIGPTRTNMPKAISAHVSMDEKCMLPQYLIEPKLSKHISWLWINYKSSEMSQQNPFFSPLRSAARCQTRICQYHLSCGRYHSFILTYMFSANTSPRYFHGHSFRDSLSVSLLHASKLTPKSFNKVKIQTDTHLLDQIMGGSIPIFKRDSSSNLFAPR